MPIYEYKCLECGHEQENLIRDGHEEPVCDVCGKDRLSRKLSVFAVAQTSGASVPAGCACASGESAGFGGCMHSGRCGCGGG